jgi:hypothetical protein
MLLKSLIAVKFGTCTAEGFITVPWLVILLPLIYFRILCFAIQEISGILRLRWKLSFSRFMISRFTCFAFMIASEGFFCSFRMFHNDCV